MAYSIMVFPVRSLLNVINRALFPVYARQDHENMGVSYIRMLPMLALIIAPLYFGLWAVRTPVVQVVLGDKWLPVSEVLTWLLPTGFLQCFLSTTGPILAATGRADLLRNVGVLFLPLWLLAFISGLRFGIVGVAAAYFFAMLLSLIPTFYFTLNEIDLGLTDLVKSIWRPTMIALLMAAMVTIFDAQVLSLHMRGWLRLAILVPFGAGFYVSCLWLLAPRLLHELKVLLRS
jgi:O-antigen/teichoic acid export membrane protein